MALGEGGQKEVEGGSSTCLMKSKAFAGFSGSSYNATSTCEWRGQEGTRGEQKKINGSRDGRECFRTNLEEADLSERVDDATLLQVFPELFFLGFSGLKSKGILKLLRVGTLGRWRGFIARQITK